MYFKNNKAFSVIEVMLVLIIISIITALVVPNIRGRGKEARLMAAKADIEANITAALDLYELDNGTYPTSEQGLAALIRKPSSSPVPKSWNGPYLKKKVLPKDPWKNEYIYESPGEYNTDEFDLSSSGPDGIESDDDIVNWAQEDDF